FASASPENLPDSAVTPATLAPSRRLWYFRQMPAETQEPYITVSEAARRVGVARQTLHHQVRTGLVRSHITGGKRVVRLSEVLRDRRNNLNPSVIGWGGRR